MHQFSIEDGLGTKRGTPADAEAMARMGKSQELEVKFILIAIAISCLILRTISTDT